MTEEESKEDPSELIYDLPECFIMRWEELMGMTSATGYDIWSEVTESTNYPTSINRGTHLKPQPNHPTSINGGRHFKSQSNNPIPMNGGRHFRP